MYCTKISDFKLGNEAIAGINHWINIHNKDSRYERNQIAIRTGSEFNAFISMYNATSELFENAPASSLILEMFKCLEAFIIGDSSGIFKRHYEHKELDALSEDGTLDEGPNKITINAGDVRNVMFYFRLVGEFLASMESAHDMLEHQMQYNENH